MPVFAFRLRYDDFLEEKHHNSKFQIITAKTWLYMRMHQSWKTYGYPKIYMKNPC